MKLSELNPEEYQVEESTEEQKPLRLSEVSVDDYQVEDMEQPVEEALVEASEQVPEFTKLESAGLGAAQGLSLGFADEAEGFTRALANLDLDGYKKYRDIARERYTKAGEVNPYSFAAGELGGGLLLPIPGAGAAKATSLLGKLGTTAAKGAAIGAGYGAGYSEKEGLESLEDAAIGGALGGVLGGGLGASSAAKAAQATGIPKTLAKGTTMATGIGTAGLLGSQLADSDASRLDKARAMIPAVAAVPALAGTSLRGLGKLLAGSKPVDKGAALVDRGFDIFSQKGLDKAYAQLRGASEEVGGVLKSALNDVGERLQAAAVAAEEKGVRIQPDDIAAVVDDAITRNESLPPGFKKEVSRKIMESLYDELPEQYTKTQKTGPKGEKVELSAKGKKLEDLPELETLEGAREVPVSSKIARDLEASGVDPVTVEKLSLETPGVLRRDITPVELKELRTKVRQLRDATTTDSEKYTALDTLYRKITEEIKSEVPGFDEPSALYRQGIEAQDVAGIDPSNRFAKKLSSDEIKKVNQYLKEYAISPEAAPYEVSAFLEKTLGKERAKQLLGDKAGAVEDVSYISNLLRQEEQAKGALGIAGDISQLSGLRGYLRPDILTRTGVKIGVKGPQFIANIVDKLDALKAATTWANNKGYSKIANTLKNMNQQDSKQRAITLYLLNADPQYRQQLKEMEEELGE